MYNFFKKRTTSCRRLFIRVFALIGLCLFSTTSFFGCSKDKCKDVTCQNGGACVDGTCNCVNGYTGANCETPPNPANYTKCRITKVVVKNFDMWSNTKVDLSINLKLGEQMLLYQKIQCGMRRPAKVRSPFTSRLR